VAVVIGALSYVTYSMNVLGNFSESLIAEEKRQKDQKTESFEISSLQIDAQSKLDGVVKNTGEIPVEITNLWIEEDGAPDTVRKIPIDRTIAPGKTFNLVDDVNFVMDPLKGYNMKMVTSRGQVQTFAVNSASSGSLWMQLTGVPSTVPSTFETTLLYTIVNNMTNGNSLYNLTPEIDVVPIIAATISPVSGPIPTSYPVLGPGEVATFSYTFALTGESDDGAIFTAYLLNGISENTATTTITIKEVTLATEAGTALSSFALANELSAEDDILFFHDDDEGLTPLGEEMMDGADPNGPGTTVSPSDGELQYISAPMTSPHTVEANYPWNMTLNYYSDVVPSTVTYPSLAFFFDCDNCGESDDTIESAGNHNNIETLDKGGGSDIPTFVSTGGPFGDGAYSFDGDRMIDNWNVDGGGESAYSYPDDAPDSTAVWLKIDSLTTHSNDNYQSVIYFGDEELEDTYEISVGYDHSTTDDGKIIFHYNTETGDPSYSYVTCKSTNSYAGDGFWHFVVAVRQSDDDCQLWIDGVKVSETTNADGGNYAADLIQLSDIHVGYDGGGDGEEFYGDIGLWMHWNDHALTQAEILALNSTHYGNNATRFDITVEETDDAGLVTETYFSESDVMFSFVAPGVNSDNTNNEQWDFFTSDTTDGKYSEVMYKSPYIGTNKTLEVDERFRLRIVESDTSGLSMYIRMDDNTMSTPSHLKTAPVEPAWPTYLTIDKDDEVTYIAYNEGPTGVWFNYQGTRLVLTTIDGTNSYGAIIRSINGTELTADIDSLYFPANTYVAMTFYRLGQPPSGAPSGPDPADRAIPGNYDAAVFLQGYDDTGEVFLRSIKLGLIHITD
jgi:hypothetical protein